VRKAFFLGFFLGWLIVFGSAAYGQGFDVQRSLEEAQRSLEEIQRSLQELQRMLEAEEAAFLPAMIRTPNFEVIYAQGEGAGEAEFAVVQQAAAQMEAFFELFNQLFRFNPAGAQGLPMRVRVFSDTQAFDSYLAYRLAPVEAPVVYLHFERAELRELVINAGAGSEAADIFAHQAFVQFLRAFVPQPPDWMLEGFAVFFSGFAFSESGELVHSENLGWLYTARAARVSPLDILSAQGLAAGTQGAAQNAAHLALEMPVFEAELEEEAYGEPDVLPSGGPADAEPAAYEPTYEWLEAGEAAEPGLAEPGADPLENFTAHAWSLASFLMNSTEDYMRSLTDSFMTLSPAASHAENTLAVKDRVLFGSSPDAFAADFHHYLDSRRTFAELVGEGRAAFYDGDEELAGYLFREAVMLNSGHYLPFFYLGLLAFNAEEFEAAEVFYLISMEAGADTAHVLYSLGLNAMAAGNNEQAVDFLTRASEEDPERFAERTEALLAHLAALED